MHVTLTEGSLADKCIFRNLMQLYQYDVSEFTGQDPDAHGLFEYNYLDQYWTDGGRQEGRLPLLILVDGHVAGFILKHRYSWLDLSNPPHFVAEFFVLRKWRRRGVGRLAAAALFRRFPGRWEVAQEPENVAAQQFWRKVIGEGTQGRYEEVVGAPQWDGPIQRFEMR
jgi:predicted acetyltransferase